MILGGRDEGALREVLVIASALGLQDPRERPAAAQQRADEAHRKFRDEGSDFASYLKLWSFWQEARARSGLKLLTCLRRAGCHELTVELLQLRDRSVLLRTREADSARAHA